MYLAWIDNNVEFTSEPYGWVKCALVQAFILHPRIRLCCGDRHSDLYTNTFIRFTVTQAHGYFRTTHNGVFNCFDCLSLVHDFDYGLIRETGVCVLPPAFFAERAGCVHPIPISLCSLEWLRIFIDSSLGFGWRRWKHMLFVVGGQHERHNN